MSRLDNRTYYDGFAGWYENDRHLPYHRMLDDLEVELVERYAAGKAALEVGCGTGLILEKLAKIARRAEGVDLSPGMLALAKERGLDVREGSATELPFADESFDVAVSFKVLAHVPDIERALAEMARVCRPGGHVIAELYNPWSLRFLAKKLAGPQPISDGRTEADVYTRWDPPTRLKKLLPSSVELVGVHGVRVFTPAAFVHRIPVVGTLFAQAERLAVSSPLRWFGGFLVAVAKKRS